MELFGWWKRWKKGDAVCKVANVESLNRVYNVLEGLDVLGLNGIDAQINKPLDAEGRGWTITIDGWPIENQYFGPEIPGDVVMVELGGSGATAATDTWARGDVDSTTGKPTYPKFNPTRLYFNTANNQLLMFRRSMTFTTRGVLLSVSAETLTAVCTISGGSAVGYTGSLTVVTGVVWDDYAHQLKQATMALDFSNGLLQGPLPSAVESNIVTFVQEMP